MEIMEVMEKRAQNAFLNRLGLTEADVRETFSQPGFSIRQLRMNILEDASEGNLREGTAETSWGQLLRVGVQSLASDFFAWAGTETIFQDIVHEMPSNKAMEFYAPMYGGQLPKPVERSGRYASSYFKGTDSMLVNEKFGRLYEFEKELWEDDKTGQIKQKAADIGQGMRIVQEMWFTSKLTGVSNSFAEDIQVPAPTIVTTPYTSVNQSANVNARLSQPELEAASVAMLKIRDPLNNLLLTKMDTLVVSVDDMFNAAKLINSTLQPSVPGTAAQVIGGTTVTAAQATSGVPGGTIGYVNTVNPLYGLYKLKVSRYLPSFHWYLMQSKKSILFQNRSPLEIIQENPASGDSFNRDVLIFKSSARWCMDFIQGSQLFVFKGYHS